jgi:hypothetical protein
LAGYVHLRGFRQVRLPNVRRQITPRVGLASEAAL